MYQFGGIYLDTDSKSIKPFGIPFQHSFVCYDGGWNTLGKPKEKVDIPFFIDNSGHKNVND